MGIPWFDCTRPGTKTLHIKVSGFGLAPTKSAGFSQGTHPRNHRERELAVGEAYLAEQLLGDPAPVVVAPLQIVEEAVADGVLVR